MVDGRIVSDVMVHEQCYRRDAVENRLLSGLGTVELSHVAERWNHRGSVEGDVLIRQGEMGDLFYLPAEGEVDVRVADAEAEGRGHGSIPAGISASGR